MPEGSGDYHRAMGLNFFKNYDQDLAVHRGDRVTVIPSPILFANHGDITSFSPVFLRPAHDGDGHGGIARGRGERRGGRAGRGGSLRDQVDLLASRRRPGPVRFHGDGDRRKPDGHHGPAGRRPGRRRGHGPRRHRAGDLVLSRAGTSSRNERLDPGLELRNHGRRRTPGRGAAPLAKRRRPSRSRSCGTPGGWTSTRGRAFP